MSLAIGLIGCGVMGRSLAEQLVTLESARLVGVADPHPGTAQAAAAQFHTPAFSSARDLLAAGVDAVIIATPGFLHRELTEQAAGAGKHVFCEKPLATNLTDCDAMIAAAEEAGVLLMVGQVLRFYPCWWKCLELVRAGVVGQVLAVEVTRIGGGWSGIWAQEWRRSRAKSGGLLMEVNAHELDFMRQVAGEVVRVYAEGDRFGEEPADFPNLCHVSLRFESGAIGSLHTSQLSELSESSGKIQGTAGTVFYNTNFGSGEIRVKRTGEPAETILLDSIHTENPVRHELRLFVEAIRDGRPAPIPGIEGRRNVELAEAAYLSAATHQAVALPLVSPS